MASLRPPLTLPAAAAPEDPPCADLSARESDYLLALRDLSRVPRPPTQAALARALGVSAPTALEMVRRLRSLGLIEARGLELTQEGRSAALVLASRRRAAQFLTHEVLGLDEELANAEAARLAPNVSPRLTRRLMAAGRRRTPD